MATQNYPRETSSTTSGSRVLIDAFRSHRIPTEDEILEMAALIADEEAEIMHLDVLSTRLQRGACELEKERAELQQRVAMRRSFISAIRRLPVELLANIFATSCRSPSEPYSLLVAHNNPKIHAPPLILSHVSCRWRQIAQNMPGLWNTISIDVSQPRKDLVPLLDLYMNNTRSHPLTIRVTERQHASADLHPTSNNDGSEQLVVQHNIIMTAVLRTLMEHATQFTELELDIDPGRLGTFIADVSFPSLHHFRNFTKQVSFTPSTRWLWDAIHAAPRLTDVISSDLVELGMMPYHQLVSLELRQTDPGYYTISDVLPFLTKIETLTLHNFDERKTASESVVRLPSLRHLIISFVKNFAGLDVLFESITAENLSSLELTCNAEFHHGIQAEWPLPSLVAMLHRSGYPLRKLSLHLPHVHIRRPETWITDTLQAMPHLNDLDVTLLGEDQYEQESAQAVLTLLAKLPLLKLRNLTTNIRRITSIKIWAKVLAALLKTTEPRSSSTLKSIDVVFEDMWLWKSYLASGKITDDRTFEDLLSTAVRERLRSLEVAGVRVSVDHV
ncbi:hypothetical protein VNI00_004847 [Paramarasmius palmivorus]|uniref:F-box domain-containing protein n=1 Tax=Paramarasmius palmivorus TaxID=297713 RepID=A0AAW0DK91_9AGAR